MNTDEFIIQGVCPLFTPSVQGFDLLRYRGEII